MKISEAWLREWVNPKIDSEALAHRLTMLGLEVDSLEPVAHISNEIVVGRVLELDAHPNADRLRVCLVDIGRDEPLSIVCGAPNVRVGGLYPTALVGAQLPGGTQIKPSKIRGQQSAGMLCSAAELGLAEAAEGILELDVDAAVGAPLLQALNLDDRIIDIDLTPNRADCFSVVGVARDLAAGQRMDFAEPDAEAVAPDIDDVVPIRIEAQSGCGRFVGRVIRGADPQAESPLWMQERLRRSGIGPIHPVVDVTNYVMLELGQPLHAYDLSKLTGEISARRGKAGEAITLLDGQTVEVDADVLVIADGSGAIGMAGIMGGAGTAVDALTRDIFLESAFFSPAAISGRARRFGMHTDASVRFERGVDPLHQVRAIERATRLLLDIAGGRPGPAVEVLRADELPSSRPVKLRRRRLAAILGVGIPDDEVEALLGGLHMRVEAERDGWLVTPPPARFDIAIEADLVEEVVRLYGYDRIPEIPGEFITALGAASESSVPGARACEALIARGYQEAVTYSFVAPGLDALFAGGPEAIPLSNPISSEMAVMRRSLWPGLAGAMQHNLSRQQTRVRIFESGVRFSRQDTDIIEKTSLAGLVAGSVEPEQWDGVKGAGDVFDVKGDLQAIFALTGAVQEFEFVAGDHPALRPGRSARVKRLGEDLGWIGEMHPALIKRLDLSVVPVLFELALEQTLVSRKAEFMEISKFPAVRRDIALVVDRNVAVGDIETAVRDAAGSTLRDIVVFDVYEGENIETGSKSVALGLILQESSRTLTEPDVERIMRAVIIRVGRDFDAAIRE